MQRLHAILESAHSLPVTPHGRLCLLLQRSILIHPPPFRFIAVVTKEATFTQLDCLMHSIWFECCDHNSSFKAGSILAKRMLQTTVLTKQATHKLALQVCPTDLSRAISISMCIACSGHQAYVYERPHTHVAIESGLMHITGCRRSNAQAS